MQNRSSVQKPRLIYMHFKQSSMFVCWQKRASTKVIEAVFFTGGAERSVLRWEGSVALTAMKRDEREGV